MTRKRYFIYFLMAVNMVMLSACGVKPAHVDPPEGAEHHEFPHTYPDPDTDPMPGLENKNLK